MPSFVTHYLFAKEFDSSDVTLLGSQGPDPFFYYGIVKFYRPNIKKIHAFGTFLHKTRLSKTISYMFKYLEYEDEHGKLILLDYIKGFLMHYSLDRLVHPFVYYRTGFPKEGEKKKLKYFNYHTQMETYLDVINASDFNYKVDYKKIITISEFELRVISRMYHFVAKMFNEYDDSIDIDTYYFAIKDMILEIKLLNSNDKCRRKKVFHFLFRNTPIDTMSHMRYEDVPKLDFLNNNHDEFYVSYLENKKSNDDFYTLFNKAKEYYISISNNLNKLDVNYIDSLASNIDFDGFKIGEEKIHYSLIFNENKK